MPRPSPDALRLARSFRLVLLAAPRRGLAGERLGHGTGSSLEFQDRRAYAAGDDVRHLDWRAFARTDQLVVRQYREEILPRVEIVIDGSRSMSHDPAKAALAVDLAALLAHAARAEGFQATLALAGDRPELVALDRFEREGLEFSGTNAWPASLTPALELLRPGSMRILVSDFLFPHDAAALVRPIAARSGGLALVQVLGGEDLEPPRGAALRLTDVENGATRDLVLDRLAVEGYQKRLACLNDELHAEARRAGSIYVSLDARESLEAHCRARLVPGGLITAA